MLQEQWKNTVNTPSSKWKEGPQGEDVESGHGGKRRKGGRRRGKDKKSKANYELEEETEMVDEHEEMDEQDANLMNNDREDDGANRTRNNFVAAGFEDSDAEDDMGAPSSNCKRRPWSESDDEDDQPSVENPDSSPAGYKEGSGARDEEVRGDESYRRNVEAEEDD